MSGTNSTEEVKTEWWETFDGILERMREMKAENDQLREENERLRSIKPCSCKPKSKKETKNGSSKV